MPSDAAHAAPQAGPRVGLFVTCLVDLFRPSVGFAAVKLLEDAGCRVEVPVQTCCGQPAYNSGDREDAKRVAMTVLEAFRDAAYVVVPSGSCGGMIVKHYPALFRDDPDRLVAAKELAGRTYELTAFLADVLGVQALAARYRGRVAYHDACAGLRELGVRAQPRRLLAAVEGVELAELAERDVCCGFGGTFCVKYPEISNDMVENKAKDAEATGADTLLAGDMGCLMNIAGKLHRRGSTVRVRHVAEVLAGTTGDAPPIGEASGS
jgi:L-lactate dehydrogenase complex protein LldE